MWYLIETHYTLPPTYFFMWSFKYALSEVKMTEILLDNEQLLTN